MSKKPEVVVIDDSDDEMTFEVSAKVKCDRTDPSLGGSGTMTFPTTIPYKAEWTIEELMEPCTFEIVGLDDCTCGHPHEGGDCDEEYLTMLRVELICENEHVHSVTKRCLYITKECGKYMTTVPMYEGKLTGCYLCEAEKAAKSKKRKLDWPKQKAA